jgi:hypothetical protein
MPHYGRSTLQSELNIPHTDARCERRHTLRNTYRSLRICLFASNHSHGVINSSPFLELIRAEMIHSIVATQKTMIRTRTKVCCISNNTHLAAVIKSIMSCCFWMSMATPITDWTGIEPYKKNKRSHKQAM